MEMLRSQDGNIKRRNDMKRLNFLFVAVILSLVFSAPAWAAIDINFAWDSQENVTGFRLYLLLDGVEDVIDIPVDSPGFDPANPSYTISDIGYGIYFFTLTAYNQFGESAHTAPPKKAIILESEVPGNLIMTIIIR